MPDSLLGCAEKWGLTVRTEALVGSFLLAGAPLATIWTAAAVTSEQVEAVPGWLRAGTGADAAAG